MIIEGRKALYLGGGARVVEDSRELAWAEKHIRTQPDLKWILGNYVEVENANDNGHVFPAVDMPAAVQTIANKPLNFLHRPHHIVGAFAAAELLHPKNATAGLLYKCEHCATEFDPAYHQACPSCGTAVDQVKWDQMCSDAGIAPEQVGAQDSLAHPHVEALSAFWHYYFSDMWDDVKAAHAKGSLYYSMEAVPRTVSCVLDSCGKEFAYEGRTSDAYCDHLNAPGGHKRLNKPHFTAGALIIPPVRPGWKRADVHELSKYIEQNLAEAEAAYNQIAGELPHLTPKEWEHIMAMLMDSARA